MRAVAIARPGGAEVLEEREVDDLPAPGEGEVLLEVAAAGVNRTDTVQRQGGYTLPPGASPYPGVECSGTILALGANVPPRWAVGDQVELVSPRQLGSHQLHHKQSLCILSPRQARQTGIRKLYAHKINHIVVLHQNHIVKFCPGLTLNIQ